MLSPFWAATTASSASAAAGSENGSGSGLLPWPGISTMTQWNSSRRRFTVGSQSVRVPPRLGTSTTVGPRPSSSVSSFAPPAPPVPSAYASVASSAQATSASGMRMCRNPT